MQSILHIDTGRDMRGGQWQALLLIRGLLAARPSLRLRLLAGGELLQRARAEGLDAAEVSLAAVLREGRGYDVVHAHDARAHSWAALAMPRTLVVARRVVFPIKTGLLSRWKYSQATHYIAISRAVHRELERAGVGREKISVVYDGVSIPASVVPYGARRGAYLGIAKEAEPRLPGLQFDGNFADQLPEARLLVYLSRSEGLGSAALMAMAHAVPVIASKVGGLLEIVEPGCTGMLVETPDDAASAIRRLQENPALAERMGLAGRERARTRFTIEKMVEGTLRVYEKVSKTK